MSSADVGSNIAGGPHTTRPSTLGTFRGSRKRIKRITFRKNLSVEFWIFAGLVLFLLFGLVPWMIGHPHHDRHTAAAESVIRPR
jgi:hypothetical protein